MASKTDLNDDTLAMLERLVHANVNSYEGYKDAASSIKNPRLAQLFTRLANQRSANAQQLGAYVTLSNHQVDQEGTILGAIHRSWLKARAAISGGDEEVVLREATRGDEHIKTLYEDLIEQTPGTPVGDILYKQYAFIKEDYEMMDNLKDAYS